MSLPTELHYAICRNVTSRGDLRRIAASSRSLQRPAEAALHQSVTLISRSAAFGVADILRRHPRFQSLVKSLRIELDIRCSQDATRNYWKELEEMIASLTALEHLNIQDGLDRPLAWVLRGIQPNQLKSLQCSFILDEDLVRVLKDQQNISDLSLKTSIVHLPFRRDYLHQVRVPETTDDIDERFHRAIKHLLESALPQLKYLHTESLALARALVPGRPVTHIWVPGASFSTSVSTAFLYQHIHVVHQDGLPEVEKHSYSSESGDSEETLALQHAGPSLHTSVEAHVSYLKTVLEAFAQSSEDVVSLRMALNLSEEGLYQVLSHMAKVLPRIRVLSFLPSYAVEPSSSDTERGQRNDVRVPYIRDTGLLYSSVTLERKPYPSSILQAFAYALRLVHAFKKGFDGARRGLRNTPRASDACLLTFLATVRVDLSASQMSASERYGWLCGCSS